MMRCLVCIKELVEETAIHREVFWRDVLLGSGWRWETLCKECSDKHPPTEAEEKRRQDKEVV